jgi:hypothetical protein
MGVEFGNELPSEAALALILKVSQIFERFAV